ncbi:hypothetical protein BC943DRAFT_336616 [Umbelopsis sp. AD052]|nr:hypothetical protein BC943DRAFT_336616 [Umbelopsis sp. AD052]
MFVVRLQNTRNIFYDQMPIFLMCVNDWVDKSFKDLAPGPVMDVSCQRQYRSSASTVFVYTTNNMINNNKSDAMRPIFTVSLEDALLLVGALVATEAWYVGFISSVGGRPVAVEFMG